ncbi:MAG TPA: DUF2336 domain-containing protein [Bosea sp. (in: a-proteobacteria)]|jgi:hypothetical protein|uniref:DUF2336 domain-containing protein n=1 Tax=Bosea sp. (in: a-proteobacteria) TaxID=1871050 RepID=UPI002E13A04A|nr:DUF2336 domain-containing protein [Bosea sp. (in: a-proteobacteria)]
MPSRISAELAHLARLARDGGLDLSQVSLRVKADLLMSTPHPAPDDLAAFGEMATALIPGIDEATAIILARKLAGWRHLPVPVLTALKARGGAVLSALLRHGMPLTPVEIEDLAGHDDGKIAGALAERSDLSATAVLMLVERADRTIDFALMGNAAAPLPRAALDLLLARSREDAAYVAPLLARRDLSSAELAPLFLFAGPERRLAMLDSLAALDSLGPSERRPNVSSDMFAGWLALAADDPAGAFTALASHLGGGPTLAQAIEADRSRDLAALALTAAGASVEDATRFLIRLGDEAAHSVERIFAVVALMRSVRPAVALRLVMQVAGAPLPSASRRGQHQPAMDPSGTPARSGATRPESSISASEVLRKLGLARDRG